MVLTLTYKKTRRYGDADHYYYRWYAVKVLVHRHTTCQLNTEAQKQQRREEERDRDIHPLPVGEQHEFTDTQGQTAVPYECTYIGIQLHNITHACGPEKKGNKLQN